MLNPFADLRRDLGLATVFIAHDLGVVEHVSDNVAVMYLGRIVEDGPAATVLRNPLHPYTRALVAAIPHPDPRRRLTHDPLPGEIPSPVHPPSGCAFHPRCALARPDCRSAVPRLLPVPNRQAVACPVVTAPDDDDPSFHDPATHPRQGSSACPRPT